MELKELPVYKLWLTKITLAAYQLPEAQMQQAMQLRADSMAKVGAKELLTAQMDWSNEEYDLFGIEEFPNLDALIEYHDCLRQIHWTSYMQAKTYLGWSVDQEFNLAPLDLPAMAAKPGTRPLYKVAFFRQKPQYFEEMEKANAINNQIFAAGEKNGVETLMGAYIRPNNEEWMAFLLERYPDLNAFTEKYMLMEKLGWYKYSEAKSYLGVATGGIISGITP